MGQEGEQVRQNRRHLLAVESQPVQERIWNRESTKMGRHMARFLLSARRPSAWPQELLDDVLWGVFRTGNGSVPQSEVPAELNGAVGAIVAEGLLRHTVSRALRSPALNPHSIPTPSLFGTHDDCATGGHRGIFIKEVEGAQ